MAVLPKRLGRYGLTLQPARPVSCRLGARPGGSRTAKVRPRSTSWGSRSTGGGLAVVDGGCGVRHAPRGCSEAIHVAADWCRRHRHQRYRCNMLRSRDVSRATSITSASAATLGVCSCWSMPRSGTGTSGFAVEATERVSRGRGSWRCWNATLCRFLGFACASGARSHESHQRKSRMVEISLSGSGEGLGGVILRATRRATRQGWSKGSDDAVTSGNVVRRPTGATPVRCRATHPHR